MFAGTTRLPMVAGWDGLLPKWFTRLHPRYLTPVNSILFVGARPSRSRWPVRLASGCRRRFRSSKTPAASSMGSRYIALFSIPLFARKAAVGEPPPLASRRRVAGLATSILYSVLSIFPIIEVSDTLVFTAKIVTVLVGTNALGLAIYIAGMRRAKRRTSAALSDHSAVNQHLGGD